MAGAKLGSHFTKEKILSPKELITLWEPILQKCEEIMQAKDMELNIEEQYCRWINLTQDVKPPCYQCPGIKECSITARECPMFDQYCRDKSAIKDTKYERLGI